MSMSISFTTPLSEQTQTKYKVDLWASNLNNNNKVALTGKFQQLFNNKPIGEVRMLKKIIVNNWSDIQGDLQGVNKLINKIEQAKASPNFDAQIVADSLVIKY